MLQKGRSRIPSELFDTQNREIFSATFHFEKKEKNICLKSCIVKTKSKRNKNVVALSTFRPLHGKTIDDGKQKPQILRFYDFTKGGTDIVDQQNDYYTTRSKSCPWVMLLVDETVPKVEKRFTGTGQSRRCQLHLTKCHTKTCIDHATKSVEQCQSCSLSICREQSIQVCHGCLQWNFIYISYSWCLSFRLGYSMIIFYTILKLINVLKT